MLRRFETIETKSNYPYLINLLKEMLSDNSEAYSIQILSNTKNTDILIDCITKKAAYKLYDTISNTDDYFMDNN